MSTIFDIPGGAGIAQMLPGVGPFAFVWKHKGLICSAIGFAVLGLMLMLAKADARHAHKLADQATQGWNLEIAKNSVNLASIANLQTALNEKNAESDARAKALADSKSTDTANANANADKRKADASRQGFIEGVRDRALTNPTCPAPAGLLASAEGL